MTDNGHNTVELPRNITVRELADLIESSPIDVIKGLMANGVMANINQQLDYDTAAVVAEEMGFEAQPLRIEEATEQEIGEVPAWRKIIQDEDAEDLSPRPPVATILGHVDHGKTSLLDLIRSTNVAIDEAGGITQHIGAYQVEHNQHKITFLDTPGHEAFTSMRARGAQSTDIAILVVAADDGVMPQTREAISHAKAARVPIVVALNKIDKSNADLDRVKRQLSEVDLAPDDWGGETMVVPVSAKEDKGIDDLLEALLLIADEANIQANPNVSGSGSVLEAEIDRSRGVVATLLVQNGTLKSGDAVIAGTSSGRIRAMFSDLGQRIEEAPPSTPVTILGLSKVPQAGERFAVVSSEREARALAAERKTAEKDARSGRETLSLDKVFAQFEEGKTKKLNLIIKADVQGSLEPIINSLEQLGSKDLTVRLLHTATGNVSESDVLLAAASQAIIIGFNVIADQAAQRLAKKERVSIQHYDIIYKLVEQIGQALQGLLEPTYEDVAIGKAEVREIFRIHKVGKIAGCYAREGELRRNSLARVIRANEIIFTGKVASLKHLKDDVREVKKGFECGIGLDGFTDYQTGDLIECYVTQQVS